MAGVLTVLSKLKTEHSQNIIIFSAIILFFVLVSLFATTAAFFMSEKVYSGVTVGGISVGDLSVEGAEQKILREFSKKYANPITIKYKDRSWSVRPEDINLCVDQKSTARNAYDVGRQGNILQRIKERYSTIQSGKQLPLIISYDVNKLVSIIDNLAAEITSKPQDAVLQIEGSSFYILSESKGYNVDVQANVAKLANQLSFGLPVSYQLVVEEIVPTVTGQDLAHIDGIIAAYTTKFDPQNENRVRNIALAAKSINRLLVRPGQTISFNEKVGPRLADNGFKEAPVFIDGKLVPDFGGGVCQVSSTLYNAALLANLTIVERASHFRPPVYVPLGQDATVADDLIDFKFKNTLNNNIYIEAQVGYDYVAVYIYGRKADLKHDIRVETQDKLEIEPNTIIIQDDKLDLGKEVIESEGQKGFKITTYRVRSVNGKEIEREFLFTDEFKPVDRIIRVGTKASPKQQTK